MIDRSLCRLLFMGLLLVILSGCAHTISSEMRREARKDLTFPAVLQNPAAYAGFTVIWGGVIIDTVNRPEETVMTVLETPLDYEEKPASEEYSRGRFIAKLPGYLDPEVYQKGRKITLAGEILGKEVRPLGETTYTYPVVRVRELHIWRQVIREYYPYYWGGFGYPYYWPYYHFHYHHW